MSPRFSVAHLGPSALAWEKDFHARWRSESLHESSYMSVAILKVISSKMHLAEISYCNICSERVARRLVVMLQLVHSVSDFVVFLPQVIVAIAPRAESPRLPPPDAGCTFSMGRV